MEKPELAGAHPARAPGIVFQIRSNGVFLGHDNLRGMFGILPEMGLVAIGVTILMICGEFDLSVGSVFALMPMSMAMLMVHGVPFLPAMLARPSRLRRDRLINGYVTIRFAIPSFIATLGMLFMARSLTVVISGGFPPLLPPTPTWLSRVRRAGRHDPHVVPLVRWHCRSVVAAPVAAPISATGSATGGFLPAPRRWASRPHGSRSPAS